MPVGRAAGGRGEESPEEWRVRVTTAGGAEARDARTRTHVRPSRLRGRVRVCPWRTAGGGEGVRDSPKFPCESLSLDRSAARRRSWLPEGDVPTRV